MFQVSTEAEVEGLAFTSEIFEGKASRLAQILHAFHFRDVSMTSNHLLVNRVLSFNERKSFPPRQEIKDRPVIGAEFRVRNS